MTLPQSMKGWLQLAAAGAALIGTVAGGGWAFVQTNAWSHELAAVEQHTVASIKALRCDILDRQISELVAKREAEGLSPRERARLENLLREWQQVCTDGG